MICKNCCKEFRQISGKQKFCNPHCRNNYYWVNITKKKRGPVESPKTKTLNLHRNGLTENLKIIEEKVERLNRIKRQLKVGDTIKFRFPKEAGHHLVDARGQIHQGVIQQITDTIITVKTGYLTQTINWIDVYTRRTKIQLVIENVA